MNKPISAVVLAAGQSSRMKSDRSKIIHPILGRPLINYLLENLCNSGIKQKNITLVCGKNLDSVRQVVEYPDVNYVIQHTQLGTAHALLSAEKIISNFEGHLLVTVGDNPYFTSREVQRLLDYHTKNRSICTFLSAVFPHTPPPYGRVLRDRENNVTAVKEEIDATREELKIREVNSSIYLFDNARVFPLLKEIDCKNRKNEYYLTDIIKILRNRGHQVKAVEALDYRVAIGINNRWELQQAQHEFNLQNMKTLALEKGVTILQPESVVIEHNVDIGRDTTIYPSTYISSGSKIGCNCDIGPFAYVQNATVPDNSQVSFTRIQGT